MSNQSREELLVALRERIAHPERFLTPRKNEQRATHAARAVADLLVDKMRDEFKPSIESKEPTSEDKLRSTLIAAATCTVP